MSRPASPTTRWAGSPPTREPCTWRCTGAAIPTDLRKAVQDLRERPHRLDHCMQAMRMTTVPKALLWKRIKALEP